MPRIRTVKPEFWGHPIMSRLADHVQLMALALINYADDEGYFLADPKLVRSFARPFDEDSSKSTGALLELSRIGWIEVFETASHGQIGRIVTFADHQVISHPKSSKLKGYCSSNIPVIFHECSMPEWKGMEGNGREPGTSDGGGNNTTKSTPQPFNETEISVSLCREHGIVGMEEIRLIADAVKAVGGDNIKTATQLLDSWGKHKTSGKFPQQLKAFIKEGHWKSSKPKIKYLTDEDNQIGATV